MAYYTVLYIQRYRLYLCRWKIRNNVVLYWNGFSNGPHSCKLNHGSIKDRGARGEYA